MSSGNLKTAFLALLLSGVSVQAYSEPLLLKAGRIEVGSATLSSVQASTASSGTKYIVQHDGKIRPSWRAALEKAGAKILRYVPENAYLISADADQLSQVRATVSFTALIPYARQYRVDPEVSVQGVNAVSAAATNRIYLISLFTEKVRKEYVQTISSWDGCKVLSANGAAIRAELTAVGVMQAAELDEVEYVSPWTPRKINNNIAVEPRHMNVTPVWPGGASNLGLTGAGQVVAVADTGLDTGNVNTMHADVSGRVVGAYALARSAWSDLNGHGTHVAGSILGNGANSSSPKIRGVAYQASLVFQSVGNSSSYLTGLPDDLNDLFAQAYNDSNKPRIHSNSWGASSTGEYGYDSQDIDEFCFNHPDMLILFAASNDGEDDNGDGVIDAYSLSTQSTAKNCLTVGAAENYRTEGGYSAKTWGGTWSSYYPSSPIRPDYISRPYDSVHQGIAAFSSRGPCSDGRIKPDIVAPGTDILSMRSSLGGTMWGTYNSYYQYSGGTSMSTPLVAGAAALVREWLAEQRSIANPDGATVKALLMAGAKSLAPGQYGMGKYQEIPFTYPNSVEGWGQVNLAGTVSAGSDDIRVYDAKVIADDETHTYTQTFAESGGHLTIVMAYADAPASTSASKQLVNDLDLKVVSPSGRVYYPNCQSGPDRLNNVEGIRIPHAEAGTYVITVNGYAVNTGMDTTLTGGKSCAIRYSLVMNSARATQATLTGIAVTGEKTSLLGAGSCRYVCTATYDNGYTAVVTPEWLISSGAEYATVDESGTVTANIMAEDGTAVLKATYADGGVTNEATFSITIKAPPSFGEAVDSTLEFTTGGATSWYVQSDKTYKGDYALQSGAIGTGQTNWVETTVSGPGKITFYWASYAKANAYNKLFLSVDGEEKLYCYYGTGTWLQNSFLVESNDTHTLRWSYKRDTDVVYGADTAYLDNVIWSKGYYVTYKPGEAGTGETQTAIKITGTKLTLQNVLYTRPGHLQVGWTTTEGGEKVYDIYGSYTEDAEVTLYPAWKSYAEVFPYRLEGEGAVVTNYCAKNAAVDVPAEIDGHPVIAIGEGAFKGKSLTIVTLPEGVTSIGDRAFYNSTVTSLSLPHSLTNIGKAVFYNTSLSSLTIPWQVASIGTPDEPAFYCNTSLKAFYVASSNAWFTAVNGVLFTKDGRELVCYPSRKSDTAYDIPSGVTNIYAYAFYRQYSLRQVTIPEGVEQLRDYTFYYDWYLNKVTLPASLKTIGSNVFSSCSVLKDLKIPAGVTAIGEKAFPSALTNLVLMGRCGGEAASAKWGASLANAKIFVWTKDYDYWTAYLGEGLSIIPEQCTITLNANGGSGGTTSLIVKYDEAPGTIAKAPSKSGLQFVGYFDQASGGTMYFDRRLKPQFEKWTGLISALTLYAQWQVDVNTLVDCDNLDFTTYGDAAWRKETSETHDGVDSLRTGAIGDSQTCTVETTFVGPGKFSFWWFAECEGYYDNFKFYINASRYDTMTGSWNSWMYFERVFDEGTYTLKWVYSKDVSGYVGLDSGFLDQITWVPADEQGLIIENGVVTCWRYRGITDIVVPEGVTSIKLGAFRVSSRLTSITLPNSLTALTTWQFEGCRALTNVVFGTGLTEIPSSVFYACSALKGVFAVPEGVEKVSVNAFNGTAIREIVYPTTLTTLENVYANVNGLTNVWFRGDAPSCLSNLYVNVLGVTNHVLTGTTGWQDETAAVPATWPTPSDCGRITVAYRGKPPQGTCTGGPGVIDPFAYRVEGEEVLITNYYGSAGEVAFPSLLDGYAVGGFGEDAFTDGEYPFTRVTIPEGYHAIAEGVFANCPLLQAIEVAAENAKFASSGGTLFDKAGTTLVQDPAARDPGGLYTVPTAVTRIGEGAFAESALKSVTLPSGLKTIGAYAFANAALDTLEIPSGVTSIGVGALSGCAGLGRLVLQAQLDATNAEGKWGSGIASDCVWVKCADYDYWKEVFDSNICVLDPVAEGPIMSFYSSDGMEYLMKLAPKDRYFAVNESFFSDSGLDLSGGVTSAMLNAVGKNGISRLSSCLMGLEPDSETPAEEQLQVGIAFDDQGLPVITCTPESKIDFVVYTPLGKKSLSDSDWTVVTDENRAEMKFFRVRVEIK